MWLWAGYLAAINIWTFLAFAADKRRAIEGRQRTPERILLQLAAAGGTPGAMAAQQILRHKTRKEPFRTRLWMIWGAQALLVVLVLARAPLLGLMR